MFKRKKIGLALGGGGVRSVSSLGVIENLEKSGYKIRYIAGTSMGAVVGALYSYYLDTDKVKGALNRLTKSENYKKMSKEFSEKLEVLSDDPKENSVFKVKFKKYFSLLALFNKIKNNLSIIDKSYVKPVIDEIIPDINIEDLKLPFCCVAVNIKSGKRVEFRKGSLRKAIMGTVAIPGIIEPEEYDNMLLSDGVITSLTPVNEARRLGGNYIIAVEVMPRLTMSIKFKSGIDVLDRANRITAYNLHQSILKDADLVISPPVKNIYWANFDKINYCIKAGESASFGIEGRIR